MAKRNVHASGPDLAVGAFIRSIALQRDRVESFDVYPYNLPALRSLENLKPRTESDLHQVLRLVRSARRQHDGYFPAG